MARIVTVAGDYKKAKVKMEGLDRTLKLKTSKRINNVILKSGYATRNYIKSRVRSNSTGMLAESIKWIRNGTGNSVSWSIYQDSSMTRNDEGRNYAIDANDGFDPHYVKVVGRPKLQTWIVNNLGQDRLNEMLARRQGLFVGRQLDWANGGMKFDRYAFNNVRNNLHQVDNGVKDAIKR